MTVEKIAVYDDISSQYYLSPAPQPDMLCAVQLSLYLESSCIQLSKARNPQPRF